MSRGYGKIVVKRMWKIVVKRMWENSCPKDVGEYVVVKRMWENSCQVKFKKTTYLKYDPL